VHIHFAAKIDKSHCSQFESGVSRVVPQAKMFSHEVGHINKNGIIGISLAL
jgi:hypothetical protein